MQEDRATLRGIMRRAQVPPDLLMGTALQVGERLSRLKPNGRLVRRSPLTPLIEIEGLLDAVHAKAAGWWALDAAGLGASIAPELPTLIARADSQIERLRAIHASVAAACSTRTDLRQAASSASVHRPPAGSRRAAPVRPAIEPVQDSGRYAR